VFILFHHLSPLNEESYRQLNAICSTNNHPGWTNPGWPSRSK